MARQERLTLDGDHFYIDLVFYHTMLKCYVIIDLKTGKLTHQDLGQLQLYVNYYDRERRTEGDNPTLGLILCADKNDAVVRYTLGADQQKKIFASRYKLHLPSEAELRAELRREVRALSAPNEARRREMNPNVNIIANRLSLRPPQRESLEILAKVCDVIPLEKNADLSAEAAQANVAQSLKVIQTEFPTVTDFERDFPSLCFALATGVGKTRLMGAFIAYLFKAEGIRHFFVLAPNLTIYNKLIADFTPNTPKYVFQGIADFAVEPPEIITGDNYESGRGVRARTLFGTDERVHVNIFNISKITSTETPKGAEKTNVPRFRRLQEYIGQSYFEYLSKLDDLVLLMDESHRYRASAGMKAIGELKPILGLELTATPHVERGGGTQPFQNVIYATRYRTP